MPSVFTLTPGDTPLLISMPHDGHAIPPDIAAHMTPEGRSSADTDWHLSRLYDFALSLGAGVLKPRFSRYVIDLNRDPQGQPLYPGADNTELCPTTRFDLAPIYLPQQEPSPQEVSRRRDLYWQPYHTALSQELDRLHARHGVAVLLEAHSIRSRVPRFFEGTLPVLNLGTASGLSCPPSLRDALTHTLDKAEPSAVTDGRFKGGFITRHHGQPSRGRHAVQLELSQRAYMNEAPPFTYRPDLASQIQPTLKNLVQAILHWTAARP